VDKLRTLAELFRKRNVIDASIAELIGRPANPGHIGEFIAAAIFNIQLESSATHKASDGHFASGSLSGKSVDVKFYAKQEGLLAVREDSQPDYFLVLTGQPTPPASSKGSTRPLAIERVYLFAGSAVAADIRRRTVKFGVAVSIPKRMWGEAEIYPSAANTALRITDQQHILLSLFSQGADAERLAEAHPAG
jgi:hypothetical protein